MSVVTDSFSMFGFRTPFIKIPDAPRMFTAMPRALFSFETLAGVVSAKPINDQQVLLMSMNLPTEFAYRMVELNISVLQDVATSWETVGHLEVTNGIRGSAQGLVTRHPVPIAGLPRRAVMNMFLADMRPPPGYVIQATRPGVAPVMTFETTNVTDPAGAAGTVNFFASFMEYELEQVQIYPVHSPTLTYGRN